MLMKPEKKSLASAIVGSMSEPKGPEAEETEVSGAEAAADDLIAAIAAKDAKGVVEAIKAIMEMAGDEESPVEEPEAE